MIINIYKVKTEALLLLCRDIIEFYKTQDNSIFNDISSDIILFIDNRIDDLLKSLNIVLQPNDYYIRNKKVSRIKIILNFYNYLQTTLQKYLQKGDPFDPSMLCFALLSTWFAELGKGNFKEFIYFTIYPYSEVYDKLLLNIENQEFKALNIKMLNIAEDIILKFNNYKI